MAESLRTYNAHNFSATRDPRTSDDASFGYDKGSVWLNQTTNIEWMCFAGTPLGAAKWVAVNVPVNFGLRLGWTPLL